MKKLLMGNAAFAHAALEAGVNVVAGYPGTPSSELVETVVALHASGAARGVHVEWSTNEKAALELLAGASLAGARCLFTCKQVGLNVASDPLMSLNYVGVKGGLVLFVADDPGPISSQTEQDTRRFSSFAKVPVLDPATPEQGYAMMLEAFELSERHGTPVIVRPTTRINHASTFFDVPEAFQARAIPEEGFVRDDRWIIFPQRSYQAHGEINARLPRIADEFSVGEFNPVEQFGAAPTRGVVAGGVSASYVRDALFLFAQDKATVLLSTQDQLHRTHPGADPFAGRALQPAYRFMQVGTPYPFPQAAAADFLQGLDEVIVFEELDHVIEDELLKVCGAKGLGVRIRGKLDGTTIGRGENSTQDCVERLAAFFGVAVPGRRSAPGGARVPAREASATPDNATSDNATSDNAVPDNGASDNAAPEPPARPPVLCAGCPHRGSFFAVKSALRKRSAVLCGDIGCYTLCNAKPLDAIDTCLCMGAGITMAQGFHVAEPDKKCVAFVGDSTFFASALTGVANAVYNQHDVTFVVLDNSTTAMTGSQPHPGTGATLMGGQSDPIDIEGVLRALGVKCVTRANAFYLDEAVAAAAQALDFEGPSAVVYTGPCIQHAKPEPCATVDAQACTGCAACIKAVGCPAMSMVAAFGVATDGRGGQEGRSLAAGEGARHAKPGRQAKTMQVDPGLCSGCGLCVDLCPFDAIGAPVRDEWRLPYTDLPGPGRENPKKAGDAHA